MELMTFDNKAPTANGEYLRLPDRRKYLVVEDDSAAVPIWERIIKMVDPKAIIRWSTTEEHAEKLIKERANYNDHFDFVIADIFLAGPKTGIDLWRRFRGSSMQFLFTSSIPQKKFLEMIGDRTKEYPLLIRKPFKIGHCIDSLLALLRAPKTSSVDERH